MKRDFIKDNFENQIRWIAHANNTASIILGLAGASFFWMATQIADASIQGWPAIVSLTLFFLTNGGSIVCLLWAVRPRTRSSGLSLVFFGDIVRRSEEEYVRSISGLTEAEADSLLVEQTYINAQIAQVKFRWIQRGILLLTLSILPGFVLIVIT